uniref:non-specific serine/threonine protein kinase n=1 Tax=Cajanus cajan TaxID=3821 RepID=A0A151RB62_CAJCA|nr:Tyrosine-sulfated glycopeptide receptor 1 [Cajanus cajan]
MNCVNLVVLNLRVNGLEGNLSAFNFSRFLRLTTLDLGNNIFTGVLPPTLYACKSLSAVRLASNQLEGEISPKILELESLSFLSISTNNLRNVTGALTILRGLKNLSTLMLSKNFFNEMIPQDVNIIEPDGFQKLQVLGFGALPPAIYLGSNHLNGSIPIEIGKLKVLHQLDLKSNNFSGSIPVQISNLTNLEKLDLSGNQLSGEIPDSLRRLHFLSFFSVAFNNLQGQIPTGSQFDTFSYSSFEGNAQLCGQVIQRSCPQRNSSSTAASRSSSRKVMIVLIIGVMAIKKLSGDLGLMEREFKAEVEALSNAQHENLVALQGYCVHDGFRLLIYTYMENGSLDYWLHEKPDGASQLDWPTRLKIAQGASCGLAYLHQICEPHIVHRDIKSSNILLNGKFEAHVADFGLSRLILPYQTHVTTELVGTLGYIPPEYGQAWVATLRGDVYSFGVVMLELLTGRRPVDVCKPKMSRELVGWVQQMRCEGKQDQVFATLLRGKGFEGEMLKVLDVACMCVSHNPFKRPIIREVVEWLKNVGSDSQPTQK